MAEQVKCPKARKCRKTMSLDGGMLDVFLNCVRRSVFYHYWELSAHPVLLCLEHIQAIIKI